MSSRDRSYYFQVSNITSREAGNLARACMSAKNRYARNGRGTSFSGRTCDLGKHLAAYSRDRLED